MESLNPQEIESRFEDCYMKKKQINDLNSRNVSAVQPRDSKFQGESSSHAESPAMILVSGVGGSDEGEEISKSYALCGSHGSISVIGRRRVMRDAVAVAKLDSYHFFAVYDGHGGSSVSNACRDRLHQLLAQEVELWIRRGSSGGGGTAVDWEKVMTACFMKMDDEVGHGGGGNEAEDGWFNTVGSSAVVVMVGKDEVIVANSGNSRAVLCRDGIAVPLSRDHKPDRADEKERVEAAGGRVINWNGCRVLGVLATSRSIGDHYLKPYVISEPEVTISERTESCDFLVIASDGLWDVVSNEFACQVARRCLEAQRTMGCTDGLRGNAAANAAALLAQLALSRGSKDNVTVVVVELNQSAN